MNAIDEVRTWVDVCAVDDIPEFGARRIARPMGLPVAVFRSQGERVHALLDRCPHMGGPLSQGIVAAEHVFCPLHNWAIALIDGHAREPDVGRTPTFRCRVAQGRVLLDAGQLATLALDLPAPTAGPCRHG
ncbi:MAG: nitrite reductase small subunit NirD [Lautropia sp.]